MSFSTAHACCVTRALQRHERQKLSSHLCGWNWPTSNASARSTSCSLAINRSLAT
jgi:hypothetical protein